MFALRRRLLALMLCAAAYGAVMTALVLGALAGAVSPPVAAWSLSAFTALGWWTARLVQRANRRRRARAALADRLKYRRRRRAEEARVWRVRAAATERAKRRAILHANTYRFPVVPMPGLPASPNNGAGYAARAKPDDDGASLPFEARMYLELRDDGERGSE